MHIGASRFVGWPYIRVEAEQAVPLTGAGWFGMRLPDDDNVDTLLYRNGDGGLFATDPAAVATSIAEDVPDVTAIRSLVEATNPVACMRMVEYRGTLSAAVVYKRQPIIDYLRRIDDNTVLGAVELTGPRLTKHFVLSRASRVRRRVTATLTMVVAKQRALRFRGWKRVDTGATDYEAGQLKPALKVLSQRRDLAAVAPSMHSNSSVRSAA